MKIGIVGSGISGLGAAYFLKSRYGHEVDVFEKNDYAGGHTNTIQVDGGLPVDTGFIVFNERTYPELIRLFDELGVESQESDMSFSVMNRKSGLEWGGTEFRTIFAQKRNLLNPRFLGMLLSAKRFFEYGVRDFPVLHPDLTIGEYLKSRGFSTYFRENFVVPMASAVWSTPMDEMEGFPAQSLLQFFKNHGMLDIDRTVTWRTLVGGSWSYVRTLREKAGINASLNRPALEVRRNARGAEIVTNDGVFAYDAVLMACHSDQTVQLYSDMPPSHRSIMSHFRYQPNQAILHSDESVMPTNRAAWASWNFKVLEDGRSCTVYWMNRLQNLNTEKNYFVSINEVDPVDESLIHRVIDYEHPLFDVQAIKHQKDLLRINEDGPVHYCGAYFRYGFHEDGLWSGIKAAQSIDASLRRAESLARS